MSIISKLKLNYSIFPILVFFVLSICLFSLFRTGLVIWKFNDCVDNLSEIFLYGLRYDISINCTMFAPVLLISILSAFAGNTPKPIVTLQKYYLPVILAVQLFVELTTIPFILEYGIRPNKLYVEYLIYPKEVISMLLNGHIIESVVCVVLTAAVFFCFLKISKKLHADYQNVSRKLNALILLLVLIAVPLGIRGTISHKPLNPSNASFSNTPLVNSIPPNSCFTAFYALRHMNVNEVDRSSIYAFDTKENVLNNLKYLSTRIMPEKTDESCPLNQVITPAYKQDKKRNIVIILEESFGARYVESLGGDAVAPNHEKLKEEGWWFERMYATGHRSVRGIEAVTAGYPSGPLSSQVKLEHPDGLTTIANVYSKLGYSTSFIYGGESHFDNMRNYFFNNGVKEIIEQKDYDKPEYVASWGVSDEDLFKKANEFFVEKSKNNEPFCSLVFTSSFHDPFDIPEGKVKLPDSVKTDDPKRLTAAMYADYALGKFFEMAKKEEYYKNTVFVVIADHDSRVRGIDAFPFTNFSIPALIISPDIKPFKDDRVVSQIDIFPTLLSLTGVSGEFPLVGQDLTQDNITQRAIIAYNEIFGFYDTKTLTLLAPSISMEFPVYKHNKLGKNFIREGSDYSREISYLNTALTMYENNYSRIGCVKKLEQNK
ncbi:Phosphoglycerol transferase MdoB [Succinivibrio dextrinosolvens]|uniref:LTA synthase family protein n=1 Tax=Succinivibrio dextrinosolvens TaxID=83771 RepID=UPI0008E6B5A5|nr:LTA synthase family protein [Succinivibrio dextrinosolvens]SFS81404.1 Phosphoglycerol transferase MdoB [Succinivibrio dextrinosolvens]